MDWDVTATPPAHGQQAPVEEKKRVIMEADFVPDDENDDGGGDEVTEGDDVPLSLRTHETFYDFLFYGAFMIPDLAHLSEMLRDEANQIQTVGKGLMHEIKVWESRTESTKTAKLFSPYNGIQYRFSTSRGFCETDFFHRWIDIKCTGNIKQAIVNFEKNKPHKFKQIGNGYMLEESELKSNMFDGFLEFAKIFMPNPQVHRVMFSSMPKKTGNINHSLKVCDLHMSVVNIREDKVQDIKIYINYTGLQYSVDDIAFGGDGDDSDN